ncbi:MAG: hypothetical protein QXJ14_02050 [Candidatus Aenigmatarchaeota archaeon]
MAKNKIVVILLTGKSGCGKSLLTLKLVYELEKMASEVFNYDFNFNIDEMFVFTPQEYPLKVENFVKKNYFSLGIDEMRFLVSGKAWQTFLNRAIADANATYRQIKMNNFKYGGVFIYNTQFPSDIDIDVRRTVDLLGEMKQTKHIRELRLYTFEYKIHFQRFFMKRYTINVGDLEVDVNPIVVRLLKDKKIIHEFEQKMVEAKARIMSRKMEAVMKELRREMGEVGLEEVIKTDETFEMIKNLASYSDKKGVFFTKEKRAIIMKMFNLSKKEFEEKFVPLFNEEAKRRGLI